MITVLISVTKHCSIVLPTKRGRTGSTFFVGRWHHQFFVLVQLLRQRDVRFALTIAVSFVFLLGFVIDGNAFDSEGARGAGEGKMREKLIHHHQRIKKLKPNNVKFLVSRYEATLKLCHLAFFYANTNPSIDLLVVYHYKFSDTY